MCIRDSLKSLTPEDRVRIAKFAHDKSRYEGNEFSTDVKTLQAQLAKA